MLGIIIISVMMAMMMPRTTTTSRPLTVMTMGITHRTRNKRDETHKDCVFEIYTYMHWMHTYIHTYKHSYTHAYIHSYRAFL